MKRNVDLTENRDFQNKQIFSNINGMELTVKSENITLNPLFQEGNRDQRITAKKHLSFSVYSNSCDCCGSSISWDFFGSMPLCKKCDNYFSKEILPGWFKLDKQEEENRSRQIVNITQEFDRQTSMVRRIRDEISNMLQRKRKWERVFSLLHVLTTRRSKK